LHLATPQLVPPHISPTMNSSNARKSRFPCILNAVLNQGFDSIYWCEDYSSFAIKDEDQFAQLLPLYFKSKNLSAFKRNLSHYGFKKAPTRRGCSLHTASPFSTREVSVYYHDTFQRDNVQALDSMRVVSSLKKEAVPGPPIGKPEVQTSEVAQLASVVSRKSAEHTHDNHDCGKGVKFIDNRASTFTPRGVDELNGRLNTYAHNTEDQMNLSFSGSDLHHSIFGMNNDEASYDSRGSLYGTTNGYQQSRSAVGGPSAVLDRISRISLYGPDFQVRGSLMSRLSDIRWSNLGSPMSNQRASHREASLHSLGGLDLSEEAFLRDQELGHDHSRSTEEKILGFQTGLLSRISIGEGQY